MTTNKLPPNVSIDKPTAEDFMTNLQNAIDMVAMGRAKIALVVLEQEEGSRFESFEIEIRRKERFVQPN